jgi:hypothetical protein
MHPWDHFSPFAEATGWLLELLARGLDGRGEWTVRACKRGLTLRHNGLLVCTGRNCTELKRAYEAARGERTQKLNTEGTEGTEKHTT